MNKRVMPGHGWVSRFVCRAAGGARDPHSRNGHDWTRQFGYVAPALAQLTKGTALIDGELCAMNEHGKPDFTLLKNSLDGRTPVVFYAFNLLELEGEDIARLPQLVRKERLEALLVDLPPDSPVAYSEHVVGNGQEVFDAMCNGDFEGVMSSLQSMQLP